MGCTDTLCTGALDSGKRSMQPAGETLGRHSMLAPLQRHALQHPGYDPHLRNLNC